MADIDLDPPGTVLSAATRLRTAQEDCDDSHRQGPAALIGSKTLLNDSTINRRHAELAGDIQ